MNHFQQESIYNLIPKPIIQSPKQETYQSKFPPNIYPTGSTFGLKSTSFPDVCNMNGDFTLPRGAHPLKMMYASFGKPNGTNQHDPKNFIKKGHVYKTSPNRKKVILIIAEKLRSSTDVRKPKIPSINERPLMGIKSEKNYILSNAVDVILSVPRKLKQEEHFMKSKDYGTVPKYLTENRYQIENEYKAIREKQAKLEDEQAKKKTVLSEEELNSIRDGLNKKLDILKREYANYTHKSKLDTLVQKNKQENLEREMTIIEKDLVKLNRKMVYVDMTKI